MGPLKKALFCIIFGGVVALISCSAISMAKKNADGTNQIQKRDTSLLREDTPPPVPASFYHPTYSITYQRPGFRPLKDSLFNMLSDNRKNNLNNGNKLDTVLRNQRHYMAMQVSMYNQILFLQDQIQSKKIENIALSNKLHHTEKVSTGVKTEALVGNAVINYILYIEVFTATIVVLIFVMSLILAKRVKVKHNLQ